MDTKGKRIDTSLSPILRNKKYDNESLFKPENMLRETRRQKNIQDGKLPQICILDPDGDILSNLLATNSAEVNPYWACYHTKLYNFKYDDIEFGIIL